MRYQSFAGASVVAALSLAASTPALGQSAWDAGSTRSAALKWEMSYLALSAIDTVQTIDCLHRDICDEGNPLFGKHPSAAKLILAKVGFGAAQFALFRHINDRDPKAALRVAQISCVVQGGVVLLNARVTFK
jgi:hypothetical protein